MNRITAILVLALAAISCSIDGHHGNGDDNYFSAFRSFPSLEWDYADACRFDVDTLRDSVSQPGDILLTLRHTPHYAYSNIWIELSRRQGDSLMAVDTFNIILADEYGHRRGHGSGPSLQTTDTLRRSVTISRHEQLTLRHIMRVDTLYGIEQAGITFIPLTGD